MRWIVSIILVFCICRSDAQSSEISFEEQLSILESELDSMSIFFLLDSILNTPTKSELGVRFGYSSSRLSAGRDFNQNQRGYAPGLTYYHKSGFYADWTTYFDNQSKGAINLSILNTGYMLLPAKNLTVTPYLERTFNHQNTTNQLKQSLGTSISYDFKLAEIATDYAFLWGSATGHRLLPSLTKSIKIKNVPLLGEVNLFPNISLMAGTTAIFNYLYSNQEIDSYLNQVKSMTDDEIIFLRRSGQITTEEARELIIVRELLQNNNPEAIELLKDWLNVLEENEKFSLLNVTFSIPISFSLKKTDFLLSYSYSIPNQLPGEILGVDPTGFFSISISRRIKF